jgi:hypothetical protein
MKTWTLTFWTPGHAPADDRQTFGCASHGIAMPGAWAAPAEPASAAWPTRLIGTTCAGNFADVLAQLERVTAKPAAAIVLFAHGTGVDAFLERWQKLLPGVPVAGGGAALGAGQARGELLPAAEDVAVLLIAEGVWRAESLNVHDPVGETVEFRADGPRTITQVRETPADGWQPAAPFFRAWQTACDRAAGDCESITFSDVSGRNVHVSFDGERLHTGADLPADGRLVLRTVTRPEAARRLAAFCSEPNALVFGCAGLRSLLDSPLLVGSGTLVGFMFGELVTLDNRPQFGNLMAVRLVREA